MPDFTETQGRYLAFIHAYTTRHGHPPAESEIAAAMCVSPPSVNQMVKTLEKKGLLERQPGLPRAIRVLVPEDELPLWNHRRPAKGPTRPTKGWVRSAVPHATTPSNLYVLRVSLLSGPVREKLAGKAVIRTIEIRGDQSLEELHDAIFQAYDRWEQHMYEFQFGKRPFDPAGPNYGIPDHSPGEGKKGREDARTTTLDELQLKADRVFGYWFDFGDDWFHQLEVERIEQAIPTVTYPRVIKRVGKSPPQYDDSE